MSAAAVLLLLTMLALHASFTWARFAVFRIDGATPPGVRLIEVGAAASIAVGASLVAGRDGDGGLLDVLAALLGATSAALFAWGLRSIRRQQFSAAFSDDQPNLLVRHGPYRFIRHPFYLAYLLAHAVPLAASRSLWALPGLLLMGGIYLRAAQLEERKFLASPLAAAWLEHQRRTGRFLPRWQSLRAKEAAR
jgi:protein-S-isoprenylcysteine O-methyltransferase Ste14